MSRGTWLSVLVGLATAGLVATATGQPLIGVTAGLLAMVAAALVYDCTRLLRRQRPTVAARPPDYHQLVIDVLRGKHTEHADALADEIERGRRRRKEREGTQVGHREVPDTGRRFWGPLVLPALLACILAALGLVAWLPDGRWWWVAARLAAVVAVLWLGALAVHRIETRTLTGRRRNGR